MGLYTSAVVNFTDKETGENVQRDLKSEVLGKASDGEYIKKDKFELDETAYLRVFTGDGVDINHVETAYGSNVQKVGEGMESINYALEFTLTDHEAKLNEKNGGNTKNTATVPDMVSEYKIISFNPKLGTILKTGASEFTASQNAWAYANLEYKTKVQYFSVKASEAIKSPLADKTETIKLFGILTG